jgi:hypothetical protein
VNRPEATELLRQCLGAACDAYSEESPSKAKAAAEKVARLKEKIIAQMVGQGK